MKGRGLQALSLVLLMPAGPSPVAAAQQPPVFETGVELVRVEVSVTRDGAAVAGLAAANFAVRDNGVRQSLNPVLLERVPLDVTLVLDLPFSPRARRPDLGGATSKPAGSPEGG